MIRTVSPTPREIWRGTSDGSIVNLGNAVASIPLADSKSIATRVRPLLTRAEMVALALLSILRDGASLYT